MRLVGRGRAFVKQPEGFLGAKLCNAGKVLHSKAIQNLCAVRLGAEQKSLQIAKDKAKKVAGCGHESQTGHARR